MRPRLALLLLATTIACSDERVAVPLEIVVPTEAPSPLTVEVVVTAEGTCGSTRPEARGELFTEGAPTPVTLTRGPAAFWVGAWSGARCGDGVCYAGCVASEVARGARVSVPLTPRECDEVCGAATPGDGGVDGGVDGGDPDGGRDGGVDGGVDGGDRDAGPDGGGPDPTCGSTGFVEVASGYGHSCARRHDGVVFCWGRNDAGQCGAPASSGGVSPTVVDLPAPAEAIGCGDGFSCALVRGGTVECWGFDGEDQQDRNGDGTAGRSVHEPVQVAGVTGARLLSVGYWHSCAVVEGGRVRCWGQNASGELGAGGCESAGGCEAVLGSTEVSSLTSVAQVAAGVGSSCALLSSGRVRCWGYNVDAQLAVGSAATAISTPSAVRASGDELVDVEGLAGGGTRSFQGLGDIAGLRATNCGYDPTGVTCWGANDEGQAAGDTSDLVGATRAAPPEGILEMSVGDAHTCAIHGVERTLSCWGNDSFGQLGDGTAGSGRRGPTNEAVALPHGTCSVATGERHTCASLTDGRVFCWGSDANGQLGGGGDTATPRALALPLP